MCPACNTRYDHGQFCSRDGTPLVRDTAAGPRIDLIGQILADRYRVVRLLGEGGMGQVFEAQHVNINKRFALKLLKPEVVANPDAVARFRQEAWSASSIGHENIIEIDDFATLPDGSVYLAMEFLDGCSLAERMNVEPPLGLSEALHICCQVAAGLQAAHEKGIVHRDMKPENIFLAEKHGRLQVKILDFGIAKVSSGEAQSLTRTGAIFGTPHYMSPEQAIGNPLDHRSDIYSLGVIMYELFTGRVPFEAESFMGILTKHITLQPKPPHEMAPDREIPPDIEAVIMKSMLKDVGQRIQSMAELLVELVAVSRTHSPEILSPSGMQLAVPAQVSGQSLMHQSALRPIRPSMTAAALAKSKPPSAPMPAARAPSQPMPARAPSQPMPARAPSQPMPARAPSQPMAAQSAPRPVTPAPVSQPAVQVARPSGDVVVGHGWAAPAEDVPADAPASGSRTWLWVGLVGVVLALGGGAAAYMLVFRQPDAPKLPVAVIDAPKTDVPAVPRPPVADTPKTDAPSLKEVIIDSQPPGAKIFVDGQARGDTPDTINAPMGVATHVVLKKDGYQDAELTIDPAKGRKQNVKLHALAKPAPKMQPQPLPPVPAVPVRPAHPVQPHPGMQPRPNVGRPRVHDPYERLDDSPKKGEVLNPY